MSCTISKGRLEPCSDLVGGINKIYLTNDDLSELTYSAADDSVTGGTLNSGITFYGYELKGLSTFAESSATVNDAGTTVVTQTITLSLKGLSAQDNFELKKLAHGKVKAIINDNMGKSWLFGKEFWLKTPTIEKTVGTQMADGPMYTVTLQGTERTFANYIASSTMSLPLGVITGATVIEGI
jgi:hypothetical protein